MENNIPIEVDQNVSGKNDDTEASVIVCDKNNNKPVPIRCIELSAGDICRVEKNRRSVTTNCYGIDTVCADALTAKQANFITNEPLKWFNAISNQVPHRW